MKNRKSRNKLKSDYIQLKNRIRCAKSPDTSLFYSYEYFDGKNQWSDFYFIGKKRRTVWNAVIVTTKLAFKELINDAAINEIKKILGDDWFQKYHPHEVINHSDGSVLWRPLQKMKVDELGGITCFEWIRKREIELADSNRFFVSESTEIDFNYKFGTGLHIVVHEENITQQVINNFIEEFIANGENAYCSDKQITFTAKEIDWQAVDVNVIE
jgi:hypothetical protein